MKDPSKFIEKDNQCDFYLYVNKHFNNLGSFKTDIKYSELSKRKPGEIILIQKNKKLCQFFKPEDVFISNIPTEKVFNGSLGALIQSITSMSQKSYLISGWNYGHYNSGNEKWDMNYISKENKLLLKKTLPLVKSINENDRLFFRIYGCGIYGSSIIKKISDMNDENYADAKLFTLENTIGFTKTIPQNDFFKISSKKDKRSRVLKLNDNDISYLLKADHNNTNEIINSIKQNNLYNQ